MNLTGRLPVCLVLRAATTNCLADGTEIIQADFVVFLRTL
jgi:hypothetical protein